jgi:hypothetical protein
MSILRDAHLRALLLLAFALAPAHAADVAAPPQKVLFIGNSNTYLNNLPALFAAIALVARPDLPPPATDMLVAPGAELKDFDFEDYFRSYLTRERFDLVILQEKGGLLACMSSGVRPRPSECQESIDAHKRLAKLAREGGARVLLFGTWSPAPDMTPAVSRGSRQVARMLHAPVVDAGAIIARAQRADRALPLSYPDSHPKALGSLLIAAALWEAASGQRVPDGAFSAEIPVWPNGTRFNLLRPVSRQADLPPTKLVSVGASAVQMGVLLAAVRAWR